MHKGIKINLCESPRDYNFYLAYFGEDEEGELEGDLHIGETPYEKDQRKINAFVKEASPPDCKSFNGGFAWSTKKKAMSALKAARFILKELESKTTELPDWAKMAKLNGWVSPEECKNCRDGLSKEE